MSWVVSVLVTALLVLLSTSACAPADEPDPPASPAPSAEPEPERPVEGDHDLSLSLDGRDREVLLHAPAEVERKRRLPLVLAFHGSPGSPAEAARISGWDRLADDHGFLVAYPSSFVEASDVRGLVDHLVERWRVDPTRVYASGFSFGASSTYRFAAELPGVIAAFAPVSGTWDVPDGSGEPAPLLAVQGLEDDLAGTFGPLNRAWAQRVGCGPATATTLRWRDGPVRRTTASCAGGSEHVVYQVERMGHEWPREATELIWEFFQRHRLRAR